MLGREVLDPYDYMQWADAQTWRAVRGCASAEGDGKLRELLVHIHMVQQAYLSIWSGAEVSFRTADTFSSLDEIEEWGKEFYPRLFAHLETRGDEELDQPIHLPWSEQLRTRFGEVRPTTFRETLVQIPSHSTYHRGQIHQRLRELGGEPPLVDYIAWVWAGRPNG